MPCRNSRGTNMEINTYRPGDQLDRYACLLLSCNDSKTTTQQQYSRVVELVSCRALPCMHASQQSSCTNVYVYSTSSQYTFVIICMHTLVRARIGQACKLHACTRVYELAATYIVCDVLQLPAPPRLTLDRPPIKISQLINAIITSSRPPPTCNTH